LVIFSAAHRLFSRDSLWSRPGRCCNAQKAEREFKSADPAAGRAGEATFAQDVLYLLRELL